MRTIMDYLSTTEIAKKWGVSKRTVTRYAANGKIEGAYLVGNTWMIPADAKKEIFTVTKASMDVNKESDDSFHFPLYLYRNFFEIKKTLRKHEELKLYSAFESALDGDFDTSYQFSSEAFSLSKDYPFKIT